MDCKEILDPDTHPFSSRGTKQVRMGQNKALIITSSRFVQVTLATLHKLRSMLVKMQSCSSVDHGMIAVKIFEVIGYGKMKIAIFSLLCQVQMAMEIAPKTSCWRRFAPRGQCSRRTTKRIYYLKSRIAFIAMEGCMDLALYSRT